MTLMAKIDGKLCDISDEPPATALALLLNEIDPRMDIPGLIGVWYRVKQGRKYLGDAMLTDADLITRAKKALKRVKQWQADMEAVIAEMEGE